jgi:hypothetical protein
VLLVADPKESATSFQGIRGFISAMAALKVVYYSYIQGIMLVIYDGGTSLIGGMFISYDR